MTYVDEVKFPCEFLVDVLSEQKHHRHNISIECNKSKCYDNMEFYNIFLVMIMIKYIKNSIHERAYPCAFDKRCRCLNRKGLLEVTCRFVLDNVPLLPSNVCSLDLRYNAITTVQNRSMENMSHLITLDLSDNILYKLEPEAFFGLKQLQRLMLKSNNLNYNSTSFPSKVFEPLSSLVYLDIGSNNLYNTDDHFKFPDDVISELTSLESISLDIIASGQKSAPFGRRFSELTTLRKIKTAFCSLAALSINTFADLPYLDSIDLKGCLVKSYSLGAMCGKKLKFLSLASVELSYTDFWSFIADFGALSVDDLVMTDILPTIIELPGMFFDSLYNTGIQKLLLNKNRFIKAIPDTFHTFGEFPTTLKILDFSENHLKEIRYKMTNLSQLDLQNNNLGQYLATNTYMGSNTTTLKEINLSFNYIHMLNFSIFHGHSMLEKINLSNNALIDITFDASSLKALISLDLSSNKISMFKKNIIAPLTTLIKTNNLTIDLSMNVLQCSCNSEYFIKWIADYSRNFLYSKTYKCKFDNGSVIVLEQIDKIAILLQRECTSHTVLIICISVAISTACIVLVFGLVYRYRWRIRYMYYMTKSRYTQNMPLNTGIDHTYNAFISYADTDKDFVINEWIPQIENNRNQKLCIHQRDFVPGEEINHNITRSIHESKKTICIITKDFLDSHFCMFEFNMARMESIYSRNGQSVLFLVFYEQMLPKELPLIVLEHVQQQSYIEYPHDEQGNVVFWEKIRQVIG